MAARRCWIGVAAALHVRRGAEGGFVMFAHGVHAAALKLKPGEYFAYYAPREELDAASAQVRAFVAIGRIGQGEPYQREMTATVTGWSRPAEYFDSHPADIYPLLPRLSFIRDPVHWGMAFRRSLFSVPYADFSLIAEAMGVTLTD